MIAEDEPLIALDLALAVQAAGGEVLGPAASVHDAGLLARKNNAGAGLLDINLIGGDTLVLAESLIELGIPVVFYSGVVLPAEFKDRHPVIPVFRKPTPPGLLVDALRAELDRMAA